jgi:hypothetical protein
MSWYVPSLSSLYDYNNMQEQRFVNISLQPYYGQQFSHIFISVLTPQFLPTMSHENTLLFIQLTPL